MDKEGHFGPFSGKWELSQKIGSISFEYLESHNLMQNIKKK